MQLVLFNLCAGLISVPFQVLIKGRVVWRGGRAICLQEGWRAGGRSPLTHGVLRSGGPSLPSGSDRPPRFWTLRPGSGADTCLSCRPSAGLCRIGLCECLAVGTFKFPSLYLEAYEVTSSARPKWQLLLKELSRRGRCLLPFLQHGL